MVGCLRLLACLLALQCHLLLVESIVRSGRPAATWRHRPGLNLACTYAEHDHTACIAQIMRGFVVLLLLAATPLAFAQ